VLLAERLEADALAIERDGVDPGLGRWRHVADGSDPGPGRPDRLGR
jgi:hypothetical protein